MLLRKPLIHLRNVCLEVSGCFMLINRHFDHVNEAADQVYPWLNGIMPCTGDPWVESSNPDYSIMNKLYMTFGHCLQLT